MEELSQQDEASKAKIHCHESNKYDDAKCEILGDNIQLLNRSPPHFMHTLPKTLRYSNSDSQYLRNRDPSPISRIWWYARCFTGAGLGLEALISPGTGTEWKRAEYCYWYRMRLL